MSGAGPDALEQQALERVQELIAALEGLADPAAAGPARELVQLVLDLHGRGLARMLEIMADAGDGPVLLERLAIEEQVKGLLLLHGLHPEALEVRVHKAVDRLRPHLAVMGVNVQAVGIEAGAVHLEVLYGGNGRQPRLRPETLRREIEDEVFDAAPDVAGITIEGLPPASGEVRSVVWSWSADHVKATGRGA